MKQGYSDPIMCKASDGATSQGLQQEETEPPAEAEAEAERHVCRGKVTKEAEEEAELEGLAIPRTEDERQARGVKAAEPRAWRWIRREREDDAASAAANALRTPGLVEAPNRCRRRGRERVLLSLL